MSDVDGRRNVLGGPLAVCSIAPLTGWRRDGSCAFDETDRGLHVVCAEVTQEFLAYTATRGNDLSTPRPELGFPGLKPGDRWCVCALRWEEARRAGAAPPVILEATDEAACETLARTDLLAHAAAARA